MGIDRTLRYPVWVVVLGCAIVLASHTQVTLRHAALRVAGVRFGKVAYVTDRTSYEGGEPRFDRRKLDLGAGDGAVIYDDTSVYADGELKGTWVWLDGEHYEVLDNTATHILVAGDVAELQARLENGRDYLAGFKEKTGLAGLALAVPRANFTLADVLLAAGLVGVAGLLLVRRRRPERWLPSISLLALFVVCALSLVDCLRLFDQTDMAAERGQGIKELIQYAEVVAAWLLFRQLLADERMRRWLGRVLVAGAAVMVLVALVEYIAVVQGKTLRGLLDINELDSLLGFQYNPARSNASGSESSRNALAMYLVIIVPLLLGMGLASDRKAVRVALPALAAVALCLCLNAYLLVCAVLGCLAVASLCRWRAAVPLTLCGAFVVLLGMCLLSEHHGPVLLDSVALHRSYDEYGLLPMPVKGLGVETHAEWEPWQQKYVERQAAMNAIGFSPLLGVGIGNYQARINMFYGSGLLDGHGMEKSAVNFMEKDAHGLYFVQGVETGLLGVGCLLWFLVCTLGRACRAAGAAGDGDRGLAVGVAGTIVALILACWGGSFLVRGLQFLVIALMALPDAIQGENAA